jgi:hypothetical protein
MNVEAIVKSVTAMVAVGGFIWGIMLYFAEAERLRETRRIEATTPYLDRQLKLYTEATEIASRIANAPAREGAFKEMTRFWELYWGELALVEDERVEAAMVKYGKCLEDDCPAAELKQRSLALAHACRDSLSESWGVSLWSTRRPQPVH